MTAFLPPNVQCTLAVATFFLNVRAWRVTKTLTKSFREMAMVSKTGSIRNFAESLICPQGGLALK